MTSSKATTRSIHHDGRSGAPWRHRLLGTLLVAAAALPAPAQTLAAAQWGQDLDFLTSSIRTHHPNPFHAVSEASFERRVDQLRETIPTLTDSEIMVEMAGLVAMLQDGHTAIRGGFRFLSGQYPLRLHAFEDGIFVGSAPGALRGAVGARLLRIGTTSAEEAYRRVSAVTSHDNEMTLRARVPDSLTIPEILHALQISPE